VAHLAARLVPGARWLDLGCAYGYLVAEAAVGGFTAAGIDVSAYALQRAGRDAPAAAGRVLRGLADRLPFADASFDVVSAFDVLEHLHDPEPAWRKHVSQARRCAARSDARSTFFAGLRTRISRASASFWVERLS
jgi:SAM-dependent methyltransferase